MDFKSLLFKKTKTMLFPSCNTQQKSLSFQPLEDSTDCLVEAAMEAMSTNRLLLDKTSKELVLDVPFEGSVAVQVNSIDLYKDFFDSMKEMLEITSSNGEVRDFDWFEEMLVWYLKMNKRCTHDSIILAYWDLLLEVYGSTSNSSNSTKSSLISSSSTTSTCLSSSSFVSCLSDIKEEEEEVEEVTDTF